MNYEDRFALITYKYNPEKENVEYLVTFHPENAKGKYGRYSGLDTHKTRIGIVDDPFFINHIKEMSEQSAELGEKAKRLYEEVHHQMNKMEFDIYTNLLLYTFCLPQNGSKQEFERIVNQFVNDYEKGTIMTQGELVQHL